MQRAGLGERRVGPIAHVIVQEDRSNQVLALMREQDDNAVLTVVNLGDRDFADHDYGMRAGGRTGPWTQTLCTEDAAFGGWDGAGDAYYEPWTQDGQVINLPNWSVVMLRTCHARRLRDSLACCLQSTRA
jgi:1,4-alpha-glucan branching enzyme